MTAGQGSPQADGELDPAAFAARWASAFNRGDLAAIMAHYHPDVEFTSPIVLLLKARAWVGYTPRP
ncbi:MAG: nuclear transport factor 2 family protein [Candidatus Dormibacteraeota bacterium]|nr:nuclear transport factor 2 family protein [Candidatus Dormibacteraeota bacterium]